MSGLAPEVSLTIDDREVRAAATATTNLGATPFHEALTKEVSYA